jgi:hypothetical protein
MSIYVPGAQNDLPKTVSEPDFGLKLAELLDLFDQEESMFEDGAGSDPQRSYKLKTVISRTSDTLGQRDMDTMMDETWGVDGLMDDTQDVDEVMGKTQGVDGMMYKTQGVDGMMDETLAEDLDATLTSLASHKPIANEPALLLTEAQVSSRQGTAWRCSNNGMVLLARFIFYGGF